MILLPTWIASKGDAIIFYATTAGILSGSVAGDHISPISDTTVLSALACDCDLVAHVGTQMGYSIAVSVVSILLGTVPIGYDAWPNIVGILIGAVLIVGFVYGLCAPVLSATGRFDLLTELAFKLKGGLNEDLVMLKEDTVKAFNGQVVVDPASLDNGSTDTHDESNSRPENHQQQKSPQIEYAEALSDVQYAAVLKGNVDETWRFTESLFCGAIPLLQKSVWDYYSHWLPPSLMTLLPSYSTCHDLKSTLVQLAKQSHSDYEDHATAVRSAATEWITNTRNYVLESIME